MTTRRAALGLVLCAGLALGPTGVAMAADPAAPQRCDRAKPLLLAAPSQSLQLLGAAEANRRATGRGVTVAVIDSGVDVTNPHLTEVVLPGRSFAGPATDRGQTDGVGHGTAIASVIAGQRVANSGLVGLAPEARILPVRVFNDAQGGTDVAAADVPRIDRVADGIRWAVANGADIVNVSISAGESIPQLDAAVKQALAKGVLVVASAGNRQNQANPSDTTVLADGPRYPAALDGVLGVTAVDSRTGRVTAASVAGPHVDVAAPGTEVLAAYFGGDCLLAGPPNPASTSYATGYVSAAAALVKQAYPKAAPAELIRRLTESASLYPSGVRDAAAGWGLIHPAAALTLTLEAPGVTIAREQAEALARVRQAPPVALAAAVDPRNEAREVTAWWLALGAAGLLLILLVGWALGGSRAPAAER